MYSCRLLNKRQCIVRVAYRGRRGRRLSHTLTVPLSVTLAASVNASVRGGPGGRSGCSSGGYRLLWPLTCLSQAGVWPLPTEVRPQLDLLRLRYRLAPVYSVTQYCSRYSILVLLILGGQCPRGSDVAWPPQGSAQARRRSGPPGALALGGGAALAALTSGPGARQRARPPACAGALPGNGLAFLQVGETQGAARRRRRWRRRRSFPTSFVGSVHATGPARRLHVGSPQQQAPVTTRYRDSGLQFLPQVFCAHCMR